MGKTRKSGGRPDPSTSSKKSISSKTGNDDDAALWERLADTVMPLKGREVRPLPMPKARPAKPRLKDPKLEDGHGSAAPVPRKTLPGAPKPPAPPTPSSVRLDRGTARALEKGRLPVEAKLDLHGMRQRDAHAALRRFLKDAQGRGLRHVLVITGKGTPKTSSENFYMEEPRGVLRQQVPGWLSQPDLAPVVVSFSEAPQRLGGGGALYVRLRKIR